MKCAKCSTPLSGTIKLQPNQIVICVSCLMKSDEQFEIVKLAKTYVIIESE